MKTKGLNMKTSTSTYKGRISLAHTTQNSIPLYYSPSFMGRDADEQKIKIAYIDYRSLDSTPRHHFRDVHCEALYSGGPHLVMLLR